jgi:hypothetical protein
MIKALETPFLLFIRIKTFFLHLIEEKKIRSTFYKNPLFKKIDLSFKEIYKGMNPYFVSKNFLENMGADNIHTYGETPLSTLYLMLKACLVTKGDVFFDLGCGRGRGVLFASSFFGIKAVGVEQIETFCFLSSKVAPSLPVTFVSKDILETDLSGASIIYFYSLFMEEAPFALMIKKLESIPKGTKVITVSYPLANYSNNFTEIQMKNISFPWGKSSVFINTKK